METMNKFLVDETEPGIKRVVSLDPIVVEIDYEYSTNYDVLIQIEHSIDRLVGAVEKIAASLQYRR